MSVVDRTRPPRTKRVFSEDDMLRMRDLYYDRDRPMIEVADAFGVPVSTFLRWIAEMGWPRRTSSRPGRGRNDMDYAPARQSVTPTPDPSPQGERKAPFLAGAENAGPNVHDEAFAIEVAAAARRELAALGDLAGPVDKNLTLEDRERRAALIANLSRAISRIDRVFELRTERKALRLRVKQLEDELDAARNADIDALITQTAKAVQARFAEAAPKPKADPAKRTRLTLPETSNGGSIAASSRRDDTRRTKGAADATPFVLNQT